MVHHIILWQLKASLTAEEKAQAAAAAKQHLEALQGQIDGLLRIQVITDPLPSSNADMLLISCFETEAALRAYAVDPRHQAVADTYVRPFIQSRSCIDYTVQE